MWDAIWINANLATMAGVQPYGAVRDGAIATEAGRIRFPGPLAALGGSASSGARPGHARDPRLSIPQAQPGSANERAGRNPSAAKWRIRRCRHDRRRQYCLLYTSDAADERPSVDLGGRRYLKKKKQTRQ